MRHLDWLAETIAQLGGIPTLKRGGMRLGGESATNCMRSDVLLKEGGINLYREHIKIIDDAKIKRLLQRILPDEESHHDDFERFASKVQKEGVKDVRGSRRERAARPLNRGTEHEHTVILQYMFQSYMTDNAGAKK